MMTNLVGEHQGNKASNHSRNYTNKLRDTMADAEILYFLGS